MNERLTLVSDTEVRILRNKDQAGKPTAISYCDGFLYFYFLNQPFENGLFDAEGRAALIEALSCLRDTGSFAALSDESAVPVDGSPCGVRVD